MESQLIHITGPGGTPYQLGQPMMMFDGRLFLGRVDPVQLRHGGTNLYFGGFVPTSVMQGEPRNLGVLLFYEACAHVAHNYPQVQLISFASSRPMAGIRDPSLQAAVRIAAAERIGATDIHATPLKSGQLVVTGTWAYSGRNVALLEGVLEEHRAIYRRVAIGKGKGWWGWVETLLAGRRLD